MRHNLNRRAVIAESLAEIDELPDQALTNRGEVTGISPHIPLADTITAVLGVKLTAKASGLFVLYVHGVAAAAAAGDVVTWTVDTYTDAVAGTPLLSEPTASTTTAAPASRPALERRPLRSSRQTL
jgi:hypothetical protein